MDMVSNKILTRILILIWISFFVAHLTAVIILSEREWISESTFYAALKTLNTLYAPYLGSLLIFFWSKRHLKAVPDASSFSLWLILGMSVIWSLVISVFLLPVPFGAGNLPEQLQKSEGFAGIFSWLVAGAFGYFFGTSK